MQLKSQLTTSHDTAKPNRRHQHGEKVSLTPLSSALRTHYTRRAGKELTISVELAAASNYNSRQAPGRALSSDVVAQARHTKGLEVAITTPESELLTHDTDRARKQLPTLSL